NLVHDLSTIPAAPASAARCEPLSEANEAAFRDVLVQSYEGTLDCPELNGVRTIGEILAGYRAAGPFSPERWWLVRAGDEPPGAGAAPAEPDAVAARAIDVPPPAILGASQREVKCHAGLGLAEGRVRSMNRE